MTPAERAVFQAAIELLQTFNSMPDRWDEIPKPVREKIVALQPRLEELVAKPPSS